MFYGTGIKLWQRCSSIPEQLKVRRGYFPMLEPYGTYNQLWLKINIRLYYGRPGWSNHTFSLFSLQIVFATLRESVVNQAAVLTLPSCLQFCAMISKEAALGMISSACVPVHCMKCIMQNTYVWCVIYIDFICFKSEDVYVSKKLYVILAF